MTRARWWRILQKPIPLRLALVVPFVLQTVGGVALVGYLSYRSGQRIVDDLANQLMTEVGDRTIRILENSLAEPKAMARTNQGLIQDGILDWRDQPTLETYFAGQLRIRNDISGLMLMAADQAFVDVGRLSDEALVIREYEPTTGILKNYIADLEGDRLSLQETPPATATSPLEQSYSLSATPEDGLWTILVSTMRSPEHPVLMLTYLLPFTDGQSTTEGVLGSSLYLDSLGRVLEDLQISSTGQVFVVDDQGLLVATSTGEPPFREAVAETEQDSRSTQVRRLDIFDTQDSVTYGAATWALTQPLNSEGQPPSTRFRWQNEWYFGRVIPFNVDRQTQWTVVIAVPESNFMAEIYQNIRTTVLLCMATLGLVLLSSLWLSRRLTESLQALNEATTALAAGDCAPTVQPSRIREVEWLRQAFLQMSSDIRVANQLRQTYTQDLERQVAAQTAALTEAQRIAKIGNWEFDVATGAGSWSVEQCRILGFTPPETLPHLDLLSLLPLADRPKLQAAVEAAIAHGTPYEVEHGFVHPDGSLIYIISRGEAVLNEQGEVVKLVGTITDITDRKQAELELRQREAQQRALLTALPDLIMRANRAGVYLDFIATDTFKVIGKTGDFIGTRIDQSLPPDLAQRRMDAIYAALDTGTMQIYEQDIWVGSSSQTEECRVVVCGEDEVLIVVRDITARKQAERALQESEARLRLALDVSGAIAWERNLETDEIFFTNTTTLNMPYCLSYSEAMALVHPEDYEKLHQANEQAIAQRGSFQIEHRVVAGVDAVEWRWLQVNARVLLNEAGHPVRMIGMSIDITERKIAEAALKDSEATNRAIVHAIPDLLIHVNWQGEYKEMISGGSVKRALIPQVDKPNFDAHDVLPKHLADRRAEVIQRAHETQSIQIYEHLIEIDGEMHWEEIRISPVNEHGALVMIRDITERKHTEFALEQEVLRRKTLFDTSMDGIVVLDPGGNVVEANASFARMLGYSLKEITTLNVADFDSPWCHKDMDANHSDLRGQVFETRHRRKDGSIYDVEISADAVEWEGESVVFCICRDITDRKQAEIELQQLQDALLKAQEVAHIGNWEFDVENQEITWSPELFRMFGLDPAQNEPNYADYLEMIHPDDRLILQSAVADAVQHGQPYIFDYRVVLPDGSTRYHEGRGEAGFNEHGEVVRLFGTALDITDRKSVELALKQLNEELEQRVQQRTQEVRESEERLRLALRAADQGLYDLNLQTGEAIVSPEYATMLGYDPATFQETNAKWIERLHPDDQDIVAATYHAYIAGEIPDYRVEFRQRTQTGGWKWVLSLGKVAVWDENGQPLRMLGTHTDIDSRKGAEQALKESRNMLQLVLDTIPQRVFWKDHESRFLGCNSAFANDYQLTVSEIVGKTDRELPWAAWADAYRVDDQTVMSTRAPKLNYEEPTSNLEGKQIWIRTNKIPLTNTQGEVIGILGCYDDITNLKQAETDLQHLNLELEQRVQDRTLELQQAVEIADTANQAKSLFLANMSHELRTPLNVILGFTQLMRHTASLDAEVLEYINIMHRSGDHLLNLINDILDLSKIEAGRITLENTTTNLLQLLHDLREMFRERAENQDLQFVLELAPDIPQYVITDPNKLRQVLINLLSNAIKFTPHGGVTLRVCQHTELGQQYASVGEEAGEIAEMPLSYLRFEVEDTGVGIAPEEQDAIFEAFTQAKAGRISLEGTGLGLTISQSIVRLMGGDLSVRSTLGQGSIFGFSIPLRVAKNRDSVIPAEQRSVIGLAPGQPAYRILVVDDQPDNRQLLVKLIAQLGLDVQAAKSGTEAIALWQQWQPDLIWMDIRMPTMDGCETIRRIRAAEVECGTNDRQTVIIALTAQASSEDRIRAMAAGCNDFVSKPIQLDVILQRMAHHLQLTYLYEEPSSAATTTSPTSDSLHVMSSEWLVDLYQAALACDHDETLRMIQQIPAEHSALIEGLRRLLRNYKFEAIVELTQLDRPLI